ncbi:NAD-dependent deacetylase sir2E [Hondaea fermentalgiana]|uniref:NAD-dependent deacetylase sir2E n=1 Tax=Hondaea fermentalgiana TaxID=2315210 RepID=A0A2R5G6Z5_9STRA|nr:NAD-dependent deacetylase sir2E [Hondaea fermentalgiana]|eukprot:GBG26827.1 NAD-dependent deacetylase sir2E [Hondaea fermentalgiana]
MATPPGTLACISVAIATRERPKRERLRSQHKEDNVRLDASDELYPFVKVVVASEFSRGRPVEWQTSVKIGDQPRWNESTDLTLEADLADDPDSTLAVELWADELTGPNKLGSRQYKLAKLLEQGFDRSLCALSDSTGQIRITIQPQHHAAGQSNERRRQAHGSGRESLGIEAKASETTTIATSSRRRERTSTHEDAHDDPLAAIFASEAPVTFNKLPSVLRKVSGKPVLSSQRQKIATFQRELGVPSRAELTFEQFGDLCERLGIAADTSVSRRSANSGSSPVQSMQRSASAGSVASTASGELERVRYLFEKERRVTLSTASYETGDRVKARFGGKSRWYDGRIRQANRDGTFDIDYDDGDFEKNVEASMIQALESRAQPRNVGQGRGGGRGRGRADGVDSVTVDFHVGDRVEAQESFSLQWFEGSIRRAYRDGTFDVEFDDGEIIRKASVDKIRPIDESRTGSRRGPGSPGVSSLDSGMNDSGSLIQDIFEKEKRVTVSNVSNVLRKITGKPVLSSQRRAIQAFARSNGIGPRDVFDFILFEELCAELGIRPASSDARGGASRGKAQNRFEDDEISDGAISSFARGQKVQAKFGGKSKWYNGTIMRVHPNGTLDINYDDGDKERGVPPRLVRSVQDHDNYVIKDDPARERNSSRRRTTRFQDENMQDSQAKSEAIQLYNATPRVTASNVSSLLRKLTNKPILASQRQQVASFVRKQGLGPRDQFSEELFLELCEEMGALGPNADDEAIYSQDETSFKRGDKVEARFGGKSRWYKGTIVRVHASGACDIDYDDGDAERRVAPHLIRSLGAMPSRSRSPRRDALDSETDAEPGFSRGDKVEARFGGKSKWYKGTIVRVHASGACDIDYDDGDAERRVAPHLIRTSVASRSRSRTRSPRREPSDSETDAGPSFKRGDKVEARFGGKSKWYKGTIVRVHASGACDIDYDDGDAEHAGPSFKRGDKVEARFGGKSKWYKGTIVRVHASGACDINYDDGDAERSEESSSEQSDSFEKGQTVEAKYGGGSVWYRGRITAVNRDGTFAIAYDDGDKENKVQARLIRAVKSSRRASSKSSLTKNARVKARFKGSAEYYTGKITAVNRDGTFAVAFDDGDFDDQVIRANIELLDEAPAASRKTADDGQLKRFKYVFDREAKVTPGTAAEVIRKVTGTALSSEQRKQAYMFCKRKGFSSAKALSFGEFKSICVDLGVLDESSSEESEESSSERHGTKRRSRSPRGGRSPRRSRSPRGKEHSKSSKFVVGDRVKAQFGTGTAWYPGRIVRVHRNGSVDIDYDDGDKEQNKSPSLRAFDKYDRDGNGELTEKEVAQTFRDMGKDFSRADVQRWITEVDADGSGTVDLVEFIQAYTGITMDSSSEDSDSESDGSEVAERKLWKREAWAKRLNEDAIGAIEDAFEEYCSKTRRGRRILPAKYVRVALVDTGKEASVSQVSEYMRIMGLQKHDALSLPEFAHAYVYMFCDPERDEFGRVGSYYEKLWGSGTSGRAGGATLSQRSSLGDTETIAALAAQTFRSGEWKGSREQHEALLRKLSLGRSNEVIDILKKLVRAFEELDTDETGEVSASDTEELLRKAGRDPAPLRATLDAFCKARARTSLPELLAAFGFVFESVSGEPTVPAAFAMLRLHSTPRDTRVAAETALQYLNDVLARPDDANLWQIRVRDKAFQARIGRLRGGIELMHAVGFAPKRKASATDSAAGTDHVHLLALRGVADKYGRTMVEGVPQDTLATLTIRREEIEKELRAMEGGSKTIGEAVRSLQQECTLAQLRLALETSLVIVTDVLQNPKDSRKWRVRCANPRFLKCIGQWAHGRQLMEAVGFERVDGADVYVLRGTAAIPKGATSKDFRFPQLEKDVEDMLWRRKVDIEGALRALEVTIVTGKSNVVSNSNIMARSPHKAAQTRKTARIVSPISRSPRSRQTDASKFFATVHARSATEDLQLKMIQKVFQDFDVDGDGYITARDLKEALLRRGHDNSDAAVAAWIRSRDIDHDGSVSLAEFTASFAHTVPPRVMDGRGLENVPLQPAKLNENGTNSARAKGWRPEDAISPTEVAFGLVRLFHTKRRCSSILANLCAFTEKALDHRARTLDATNSSKPQQQQDRGKPFVLAPDDYVRHVAKTKGAAEILSALHWTYDGRRRSYVSHVDAEEMEQIRARLRELDMHRRGLEFPEVANAKAVGGAVASLGGTPSTQENRPSSWLAAMETVVRYLENVLHDPQAPRFRRINIQNETFRRRIGRLQGGIEVLIAAGFRETEESMLLLPEKASLPEIKARLVEIKAGIEPLREQAKLERNRVTDNPLDKAGQHRTKVVRGSDFPQQQKDTNGKEEAPQKSNEKPHGFANRRIESLRIKELEAQVHVLKEKLVETRKVKKASELQESFASSHRGDETADIPFELVTYELLAHERSRNSGPGSKMLKRGSGLGGGALLGASASRATGGRIGPLSRSGAPLVRARVSRGASRGQGKLFVTSDQGFRNGDMILVGKVSETQEARFVVGFSDGCLILDRVLEFDHEEGSPVITGRANKSEMRDFRRREIADYVVSDILLPLVENCVDAGEAVVRARDLQRRFEERPLMKPVFVSRLEHESTLGEDALLVGASTLARDNPSFTAASLPNRLWYSEKMATLYVLRHANEAHVWTEAMSPLELRDLFELIDADGDGRICRDEVVAAASSEPRVAALLSAGCFRNVDGGDHDSSQAFATIFDGRQAELTWEEFASFFSAGARRAAQERATPGWWTTLRRWCEEAWASGLSEDDLREMHVTFSLFDADADGKLSFQEWRAACQSMDGVFPTSTGWPDAPRSQLASDAEAAELWSRARRINFAEFGKLRAAQARRHGDVHAGQGMSASSALGGLGILTLIRRNLRRLHAELLRQYNGKITKAIFLQGCFDDTALLELMHFPLAQSEDASQSMETLETRLRQFGAHPRATSTRAVSWADIARCVNASSSPTTMMPLRAPALFSGRAQRTVCFGQDDAKVYEVACDQELQRVFVLYLSGALVVWSADGQRELCRTQVMSHASPARHAIATGSRAMRVLQFDSKTSLLIVCTAPVDNRFQVLESVSLRNLRDITLHAKPAVGAELAPIIEVAEFSSRWDAVICAVSGGAANIQILCARFGHPIALVPTAKEYSGIPRLLYVPDAEFLVAGDAGETLRFWDLAEQLRWRRAASDASSQSLQGLLSKLRKALALRASLDDNEDSSRRAVLLAQDRAHLSWTVRYADDLGGTETKIDACRLRHLCNEDVGSEEISGVSQFRKGMEVIVVGQKLVDVAISRLYPSRPGHADVLVVGTGEGWTSVMLPEELGHVDVGDRVRIPLPAEHGDVEALFARLDENGDGVVSLEELSTLVREHARLDLHREDLARVFDFIDVNKDGQVSLRELSAALKDRDEGFARTRAAKRPPKELVCRHTTVLPGKGKSTQVTALAFLRMAGLVCAATSGGKIHLVDPLVRRFRLTHRAFADLHAETEPELTQASENYACVHSFDVPRGGVVSQLSPVYFQSAGKDTHVPVTLNHAQAEAAKRADQTLQDSLGPNDALVQGFAYVSANGSVLVVAASGFDENMVLLQDQSLFGMTGAMTRPGGWSSGTDDLRQAYRLRTSVRRVFYLVSKEARGLAEVRASLERGGLALLDLMSIERALENPHVHVFPFYQQGDGPNSVLANPRSSSSLESVANHVGMVTRRIGKSMYEVAYDASRSVLKLPRHMLEPLTDAHSSRDLQTGERVRVQQGMLYSDNRIASDGAVARDDSTGSQFGPPDDGSSVELLSALFIERDGSLGVGTWSVDRINVLTPARDLAYPLSRVQRLAAVRSGARWRAMAHQSVRAAASLSHLQVRSFQAAEVGLLEKIGEVLRNVSLRSGHGDPQTSAEEAFQLARLLPQRWGARFRNMLRTFREIFDRVAQGQSCSTSSLIDAVEYSFASGDEANNLGLDLGLGGSFARFRAAITRDGKRQTIELVTLLECVVRLHSEVLAPEEAFDVLQQVHFLDRDTCSPDQVLEVCRGLPSDAPGEPNFGFSEANFVLFASRIDPFWSVRDAVQRTRALGSRENLRKRVPQHKLVRLASLVVARDCTMELAACNENLKALMANLKQRAVGHVNASVHGNLLEAPKSDGNDAQEDAVMPENSSTTLWNLGTESTEFLLRSSERALAALDSAAPPRYRLALDGEDTSCAQSMPQRTVHRAKGWTRQQGHGNPLDLWVHVVDEQKLARIQSYDGQPYEAHLEREAAMYRLLEKDGVAPTILDNARPVEDEGRKTVADGSYTMVFGALPGWRTLRECMDAHGYLGHPSLAPLLLSWSYQLLRILKIIHAKGIVLRGPRPRQILVSPCGRFLRLSSLATAGLLALDGATEGDMVAGPDLGEVVSPEERGYDPVNDTRDGARPSKAYDMYCFGCLLMELITGSVIPRESNSFPYGLFQLSVPNAKSSLSATSTLTLGPRGELQLRRTGGAEANEACAVDASMKQLAEFKAMACAIQAGSYVGDDLVASGPFVIDIAMQCLKADPGSRPLPQDLMEAERLLISESDFIEAGKIARRWLARDRICRNVRQGVAVPLEILIAQTHSQDAGAKWHDGAMDPRMLLDAVEAVVDCCCCSVSGNVDGDSVLESSPSLCDEVVAMGALQSVVKLTLRFFSSGGGADVPGRGISDLAFLEGDPSEPLRLRVLKRVIFGFQTIGSEFARPATAHVPMAKHVGPYLRAILCLYFGREDGLEDDSKMAEQYPAAAHCQGTVHWTPELEMFVAPLLRQIITDEGGGNPRLPAVREYIGTKNAKVNADSELADHSEVPESKRSIVYLREVLSLGHSLSQLASVRRKSRSRFVAGRQVLSLLRSPIAEHARLCLDMDLASRAVVLIGDADLELTQLALDSAKAIMDGLSDLAHSDTFSQSPREELLLRRAQDKMGLVFSSASCVSMLVQRVLSDTASLRESALDILQLQVRGGEAMTAAWQACDVFPALFHVLRKSRSKSAAEICSTIAVYGNRALLTQFHAHTELVELARDDYNIEVPRAIIGEGADDAEAALERLLDDTKEASLVDEVRQLLGRIRVAVTVDFVADRSLHEIYVALLKTVFQQWVSDFWAASLDSAQLAQERIPVIKVALAMAQQVILSENPQLNIRQASFLLRESGCFAVFARIMQEDFTDFASLTADILSLQTSAASFLLCECAGQDEALEALMGGIKEASCGDLATLYRTYVETNVVLLRESTDDAKGDEHRDLLFQWPQRSAVTRRAWSVLLRASAACMSLQDELVRSGFVQHLLTNLLNDRTRLVAGAHQLRLRDILGPTWNESCPLRMDAVNLVCALCQKASILSSLRAELVANIKAAGVISREARRLQQGAQRQIREAQEARSVLTAISSMNENQLQELLVRERENLNDDAIVSIFGNEPHPEARRPGEHAPYFKEVPAENETKTSQESDLVADDRRKTKASKATDHLNDAPQRGLPSAAQTANCLDKLGDAIVDAEQLFREYARQVKNHRAGKQLTKSVLGKQELQKLLQSISASAATRRAAANAMRAEPHMDLHGFYEFYATYLLGCNGENDHALGKRPAASSSGVDVKTLDTLFKRFDSNQQGVLSMRQTQAALSSMSGVRALLDGEVETLARSLSFGSSTTISFAEFCKLANTVNLHADLHIGEEDDSSVSSSTRDVFAGYSDALNLLSGGKRIYAFLEKRESGVGSMEMKPPHRETTAVKSSAESAPRQQDVDGSLAGRAADESAAERPHSTPALIKPRDFAGMRSGNGSGGGVDQDDDKSKSDIAKPQPVAEGGTSEAAGEAAMRDAAPVPMSGVQDAATPSPPPAPMQQLPSSSAKSQAGSDVAKNSVLETSHIAEPAADQESHKALLGVSGTNGLQHGEKPSASAHSEPTSDNGLAKDAFLTNLALRANIEANLANPLNPVAPIAAPGGFMGNSSAGAPESIIAAATTTNAQTTNMPLDDSGVGKQENEDVNEEHAKESAKADESNMTDDETTAEEARRESIKAKKREATRRLRAKWKKPKEVSEFSRARPKRGSHGAAVDPAEPPISKLASMILEGKRVVFVTGAGLSVASGIPPFRGQHDAVWEESVYTWGTREKFEEDPLAWYNTFWLRHFDEGKAASYFPNLGHVALARICANYPDSAHLITQNIDRLHRHSNGSIADDQLIEIHGYSGGFKCYSDRCPYSLERVWHAKLGDKVHRPDDGGRPRIRALADLPRCPECSEILCPNCLLFDEDYTDHESYQFDKAKQWFSSADAFVFVGTSFAVQITNLAFIAAATSLAPIFNFNMVDNVPEHFRLRVNCHFIPGRSEVTLPQLADLVCASTAEVSTDSAM